MDAAQDLLEQRERFERWKRMNEASPTDPAHALVRAMNEQTLAIYLVGCLLLPLVTPQFISTPLKDTP